MKIVKRLVCKFCGHNWKFSKLGYNQKVRHYKVFKCARCGKTKSIDSKGVQL